MATTSPPLPSYTAQNNLPVSTVIPDLINIGVLPGDSIAPANQQPFVNPQNVLLGYSNWGGGLNTPATFTTGTDTPFGFLVCGFQNIPTGYVAGMTLKVDCSCSALTGIPVSGVVEYS